MTQHNEKLLRNALKYDVMQGNRDTMKIIYNKLICMNENIAKLSPFDFACDAPLDDIIDMLNALKYDVKTTYEQDEKELNRTRRY